MSVVLLVAVVVSLIVAWAVAAALVLLAKLVPELTLARSWSTPVRAGLVLGPALLAGLALLVILVPNPLGSCHCFAHGAHHPHLCVAHPWLASSLLGWTSPTAALWLAFTVWRSAPVIRDLLRAERWRRELRREPSETLDGIELRLIDNLGLGAFTIGIWRPLVIVDRSLWNGLEPNERRAVIHHEHAHALRRDALTLACLRLETAALPWRSKGAWVRAWKAAAEAVCDRHAAAQLQDATCVAMALVSVERMRTASRASATHEPALGVAAGTDLGARVRALLDDDRLTTAPLVNDLRGIAIGLLGASGFLLLWPGSAMHHATESLLGLFAR